MKNRQVVVEYFQRIIDGESFGEVNKDLICGGKIIGHGYCPSFFPESTYTWKPKTITLEIPEPMRVKPKDGDLFFLRRSDQEKGYDSEDWVGYKYQESMFKNGIWDTEEKMEQVIDADRGAVN